MPTSINPGSYTIKYMLDVPKVVPTGLTTLRAAQIAAYGVQPRFGTLAGDAVQPRDAEFIVNRIADDNITGVIRLTTTAPTTQEAIGDAIVQAFRSQGQPAVAPHLTAGETTPAAALFSPLAALIAAPFALASSLSPTQREAIRRRFGKVVIQVDPRIRNDTRPAAGATVAGAALAATSTRVSADPARDGAVGAGAVREAIAAAGDAIAMPPWLIATLAIAGVAAAGFVGFAVYRRISGR